MSLKILLFPLCLILSLTISIAYIKPDITEILEKRATIASKKTDLGRVDATIAHVNQMLVEINQRSEGEKFVLKYLPLSIEEERILDTFNYLANQSGVSIIEAELAEDAPVEIPVPEVLRASASFQALADAQVVEAPTPPISENRITNSYTAKIVVMGAYANVKDFFRRMSQSDRFRNVAMFAIEKPTQAELKGKSEDEEAPDYPSDFLRGTYQITLVHFPIYPLKSALNTPLFQKEHFDFNALERLMNHVSSPLPPLEANTSTIPNPFQ